MDFGGSKDDTKSQFTIHQGLHPIYGVSERSGIGRACIFKGRALMEFAKSFSRETTSLVDALLEAGCNMWAVGEAYYVGEPLSEFGSAKVQKLLDDFGSRRHLTAEISGYLKSIGRDIALYPE